MKKKVLASVEVVADLDRGLGHLWRGSQEQRAKELERLVSEFNEFIRDHRSMDFVLLEVRREYEDQCGFCNTTWEVDEDGVPVCCDAAIREHESNEVAA